MSITVSFSGRCGFLNKVNRDYFRALVKRLSHTNGVNDVNLNYIFLSDEELLEINREHLQHDYYTDIITFDLSESEMEVFGEFGHVMRRCGFYCVDTLRPLVGDVWVGWIGHGW